MVSLGWAPGTAFAGIINFVDSTTVFVERGGSAGSRPAAGNARWSAMDDVTYDPSVLPIPGPAASLVLGGAPLAPFVLRLRGR